MSNTITLSSNSSVLSAYFYPPIELDKHSRYGLGVLGFYSYNSIFNINEENNFFGVKFPKEKKHKYFRIKPGAYEIEEIGEAITKILNDEQVITSQDTDAFNLLPNNSTLKCEIKSKFEIDFTNKHSIGQVLGFEKKILLANILHESTLPLDIIKVRMIRVDCNITSGAYLNSEKSHTIIEFDIDVEPGFKITKEPQNIIYLPVRPEGRQFIDNITLRVLDDTGNLINFQGEKIIVKLELKKIL